MIKKIRRCLYLFSPIKSKRVKLFSILLTAIAFSVSAESLKVQTETPLTDSVYTWQQITAVPSKNDQFLLRNQEQGIFHLNQGKVEKQALIPASLFDQQQLAFTALAIHPSYSLRDQTGFHTIYTAHTEPAKNIRTKLGASKALSAQTQLKDAVITEWQTKGKELAIDASSKREVLRIAIPNSSIGITHLAFKPHAKVWDADYGLMHIALNGTSKLSKNSDIKVEQNILYSGNILRIHPAKFGLRQYTIPSDNPFITDEALADVIYITGLGKISEFVWPEKDTNRLLVRHGNNKQDQLTLLMPGSNLNTRHTKTVISDKLPKSNSRTLLTYQGGKFSHLRGTTLTLAQTDNGWQLASTKMPRQGQAPRQAIVEWQFKPTRADDNGPLTLVASAQQELLIYNHASQSFSALTFTNAENRSAEPSTTEAPLAATSGSNMLTFILFTLLAMIAIWVIWRSYKKHQSARYMISKVFSHFQIDETNKDITLFHKGEKSPARVIPFKRINELVIELNQKPVLTINKAQLFSNKRDEMLREFFSDEKRIKMSSGRIRQIILQLNIDDEPCMPVCGYMRKGDKRITRGKFEQACETVISFCWLLSQSLSPDNTEARSFIPEPEIPRKTSNSIYRPPQLVKSQAPKAKPNIAAEPSIGTKQHKDDSAHKNKQPDSFNKIAHSAESTPESSTTQSQHSINTENKDKIDTNLIAALEKLAALKAQGMLTEEEFEQAKKRILQGLISS